MMIPSSGIVFMFADARSSSMSTVLSAMPNLVLAGMQKPLTSSRSWQLIFLVAGTLRCSAGIGKKKRRGKWRCTTDVCCICANNNETTAGPIGSFIFFSLCLFSVHTSGQTRVFVVSRATRIRGGSANGNGRRARQVGSQPTISVGRRLSRGDGTLETHDTRRKAQDVHPARAGQVHSCHPGEP